jgi:hypothetical protein
MDRLQDKIAIVTRDVRGFGKRITNKLIQERDTATVIDFANDTCVKTVKQLSEMEYTATSSVAQISKQELTAEKWQQVIFEYNLEFYMYTRGS